MRDSNPRDFDDDDIDYDPITETYHLSFDREEWSRPTMIVAQFVSYITDTSPTSLPPLHSAVETDGLDTWLSATQSDLSEFEVSFTYAGYQITMDSDGNIWVQPTDDTGVS